MMTTVTVYSIVTSIVSMYFELRSLVVYKRLAAFAKRKHRNDFMLLCKAFRALS